MEQITEAQERPEAVPVVEVESSVEGEHPGILVNIWDRMSRFGRRQVSSERDRDSSRDLEDMLNDVAGNVPDDESPPDDEPSSSSSTADRCGVCDRSFRNRGVRVLCTGCGKQVHKEHCVKYVQLSEYLQAGMCVICCNKVQDLIEDTREYLVGEGLDWDQENWLRKLVVHL